MGITANGYRKTVLFITGNSIVEKFSTQYGKRLARRFIAGETHEEALNEMELLGKLGIMGTIDHLGEGITQLSQAAEYREQYIKLIDGIAARNVNSHVSLKPTQMGLALSAIECLSNIREVVRHAKQHGTFVRIDMENSPYTQETIQMVRQLHAEGLTNVGTVLQAYLFRTAKDASELMAEGVNLRLVKGAYKENSQIAFQNSADIIKSFKSLIQLHLDHGVYTAIASHDDEIIEWVKSYAKEHGISKHAFEFQMLYGLRMHTQAELAKQGYRVRCYVPYGEMWYPYFTRRIAEKPANLMLVLKHMSIRKR